MPSVREAHVRPAELVRRAEQHVAADLLDVDGLVRRVVHGVDPARARRRCARARQTRFASVIEPTAFEANDERDDAHAVVELALEVVEVEAKIVGDVDPVELEAAVGGELDPRGDAAVVVEAADEDLVALAPVARRGAGEREVEGRHVAAEDHVVGRAVEEARPRRRAPGRGSPRPARPSRTARRGCRWPRAARSRDRLADLVGDLRAAGRVEERKTALERGEALPDRIDIE